MFSLAHDTGNNPSENMLALIENQLSPSICHSSPPSPPSVQLIPYLETPTSQKNVFPKKMTFASSPPLSTQNNAMTAAKSSSWDQENAASVLAHAQRVISCVCLVCLVGVYVIGLCKHVLVYQEIYVSLTFFFVRLQYTNMCQTLVYSCECCNEV